MLNSTRWSESRPTHGFIPPATADEAIREEWIDPAAVARLRMLVEQTGASVVLMSSWRHRMPMQQFTRLLELFGWQAAPVIGATPDIPGVPRGEEVRVWLAAMDCRATYICLDDDGDFLPGQPHIRTDPDVGLTDDDVRQCIATLTSLSGDKVTL